LVCIEQEYDAQADMLDDPENPDEAVEMGSFAPDFNQPPMLTGQQRVRLAGQSVISEVNNGVYGGSNSFFGHFDPMLDADPFGLSASMYFRTPFSYEQNVRQ
jgi:hypothetical protein